MGLDQFLYLEKYESTMKWDDNFAEKSKDFYPAELKEIVDWMGNHDFLSKTTQYKVGYWRKVNAIHRWFVEKFADGVDECQDIYVDKDDLKELISICRKIIAKPALADELIPTQPGFFFGSTEYDEWYFKDLEYTVEMLEPVVKFLEEEKKRDPRSYWSVVYNASW